MEKVRKVELPDFWGEISIFMRMNCAGGRKSKKRLILSFLAIYSNLRLCKSD